MMSSVLVLPVPAEAAWFAAGSLPPLMAEAAGAIAALARLSAGY